MVRTISISIPIPTPSPSPSYSFQCSQCAKPIETTAFAVLQEKPWCQDCISFSKPRMWIMIVLRSLSLPPPSPNSQYLSCIETSSRPNERPQHSGDTSECGRCGTSINGAAVKFGGKSWCHSCVVCSQCDLMVEPGHGFMDASNSSILCDTCAVWTLPIPPSPSPSPSPSSFVL